MKIAIDVEFKIGETVYLKTDPDQHERLVTGLFVAPNDILYLLTYGDSESRHYAMEITGNKNYSL